MHEQIEQEIAIQESMRASLGDSVVDATFAALRGKLAALYPHAGQRKQLTVLSVQLDEAQGDASAEAREQLWQRMNEVINSFGGEIDAQRANALVPL